MREIGMYDFNVRPLILLIKKLNNRVCKILIQLTIIIGDSDACLWYGSRLGLCVRNVSKLDQKLFIVLIQRVRCDRNVETLSITGG